MNAGWIKRKLGDVISLEYGKPLPIEQRRNEGGYPAYGANGIKCYADQPYWNKPSIVVGRKGTAGAVTLVDAGFWPLDVAYYVSFDENRYELKYLFYKLSFLNLPALAKGVKPGINRNDVYVIEQAFPPLSEQKRIVAILDEAFAGIETAVANAEKNLANARELFESYLDSVFSQQGKGWKTVLLQDVLAEQPRNGWSPPAKHHSDSGTPVLTLSSVTGFQFRSEKIKFTSAETASHRHYWVSDDDLLITRSNTPDLVGHVAVACNIKEPTIYPDLIMKMKPKPTEALTKFLYYQLRTPALRREITGRAQGANPTMKKIGKKAVQTLPIAIPSVSVQQSIISSIESIGDETQRLKHASNQKLTALAELKQSLLQKAFSGELTAEPRPPKEEKETA